MVRATNTTGQRTDQTVTVTVTNVLEATLTFDFAANTSTDRWGGQHLDRAR